MKTKIVNKGNGYWLLVTDEDDLLDRGRPLILMSISNHIDNKCYRIQDFRYAKCKEPYRSGDQYSQWHTLDINEESTKIVSGFKKKKGFPFAQFEVNEKENYYSWLDNDGLVLEGCDRPFKQQDSKYPSLIHPHWVWSYKSARKKMKEAKEFWAKFSGDWTECKIENKYLLPSGMYLRMEMRRHNEK